MRRLHAQARHHAGRSGNKSAGAELLLDAHLKGHGEATTAVLGEYAEYAEYDTLCVRGAREGQCTSRGNIGEGAVWEQGQYRSTV